MSRTQASGMVGILLYFSSCIFTQLMAGNDVSCPDTPNCVSSLSTDPDHYIEPFTFKVSPAEAMLRLKSALLTEKRVTIVKEQATSLSAEVRSLIFRFVDDVEFILLPEQGLIHIRSAARTGYSDFGVNRRRIERIRKLFQK